MNLPECRCRVSPTHFLTSFSVLICNITLTDHQNRVRKMKEDTGIDVAKSTHIGRPYTAKVSREAGSSQEGTMALGLWMSEYTGSFRPCYDRVLPLDALLGAAGFNAQKQETYFVAREHLGMHVILKTKDKALINIHRSPNRTSHVYFSMD
jgi:hypothetical protein